MNKSDLIFNYTMATLGAVICIFLGVMALMILAHIWKGEIKIETLLQETNGNASMSRFQLLIFTMVIAISFFYLVADSANKDKGRFPDVPGGVLTLLGISASTYAVGKGISYSRDEGVKTPEEMEKDRDVKLREVEALKHAATHARNVQVAGNINNEAPPPPAGA